MPNRKCISQSPRFQRKVLKETLEIIDIVEVPKPKAIFIVGSYAQCTHTSKSDIDLFLQYPKGTKSDDLHWISESMRDYIEEMAFEPSGGAIDPQFVSTKTPYKPYIKIF